jgi:hypothetical protein
MATKPPLADRYRAGNLVAAGAILEDIARYGGEDMMLVKWARLTVGCRRDAVVDGNCCWCGLPAFPVHQPGPNQGVFCCACCRACRQVHPECGLEGKRNG